jgi:hypothetical protein
MNGTHALRRNLAGLIAAMAAAACLLLMMLAPSGASAAESPYCGGWLGSYGSCNGASRLLWGVQGWGDQASVCVGTSYYENTACSSGGGHYAYAPQAYRVQGPWIQNNSGVNNLVHGIAYQ